MSYEKTELVNSHVPRKTSAWACDIFHVHMGSTKEAYKEDSFPMVPSYL